MFQSTHPHGVRLLMRFAMRYLVYVSIHAPTRGATRSHDANVNYKVVSIHAPTRGATFTSNCVMVCWKFQSTHPHGVRPSPYDIFIAWYMFQSTHPHGVRLGLKMDGYSAYLFQSTHPHGVRRISNKRACENVQVSIHAPTRGATSLSCFRFFLRLFQSTHPHGVRPE